MDNEKFQELVLKKLDSLDNRVGSLEGKVDSLDNRVGSLEGKVDSLDKRQDSLECDFKVMLKMMEKFSEKLDSFGQNQERLERIVLRIENDSMNKVRALFEKSDIHDDRLNDHEERLKTLEEKNKIL